jgi:hypothetical protein
MTKNEISSQRVGVASSRPQRFENIPPWSTPLAGGSRGKELPKKVEEQKSSESPKFNHADLRRAVSDKITERVGGIVATDAILV